MGEGVLYLSQNPFNTTGKIKAGIECLFYIVFIDERVKNSCVA